MGYRIFPVVFFSLIFLISAIFPPNSFGEEKTMEYYGRTITYQEVEFFPSKEIEIIRPPTYCVIIPPHSEIPFNTSREYALRFAEAVNLWSEKLMAEDPKNIKKWFMKTLILKESNFEENLDKCDIPVKMQLEIHGIDGKYCPSNSHLYYEHLCGLPLKDNSPWILLKVSSIGYSTDYFFGIALHEIGHSLGLGHNLDYEHQDVTTDSIPSNLVIRPILTIITQEDIDVVKSVFGESGFFALSLDLEKSVNTKCGYHISCETVLADPGKSVSYTGHGYIPNNQYTKGVPAEIIIKDPDQTFRKLILPVTHSVTKPFVYILDFPSEAEHGEYEITEYYKNQRMYTTILTVDIQTDPAWIGISDYCKFYKKGYPDVDCHSDPLDLSPVGK